MAGVHIDTYLSKEDYARFWKIGKLLLRKRKIEKLTNYNVSKRLLLDAMEAYYAPRPTEPRDPGERTKPREQTRPKTPEKSTPKPSLLEGGMHFA